MRKLARIEIIEDSKPIEGADLIQAYNVGGWWVVGQKATYNVGQKVVFCEIDSWIAHDLAPFLSKGKEPREFEGIKGERLKTIKLKGQISQGLMLPLDECASYVAFRNQGIYSQEIEFWNSLEIGTDVSEYLGIVKWEKPINAQLAGKVKGNFPSWGRKTDQERIQNLKREFQKWYDDEIRFEVTVKMDGSSMSVGRSPEGEFVVCSRNLMLDLDNEGNAFVECADRYNLAEKTEAMFDIIHPVNKGFLIQGELCGEGIQGNKEKLTGTDYFVYDIYVTETGSYMDARSREVFVGALGLKHVPVLHRNVTLKELGLDSVEKVLAFAEGKSYNPQTEREGVVFKSVDGKISFKAVSQKWLLDNPDE